MRSNLDKSAQNECNRSAQKNEWSSSKSWKCMTLSSILSVEYSIDSSKLALSKTVKELVDRNFEKFGNSFEYQYSQKNCASQVVDHIWNDCILSCASSEWSEKLHFVAQIFSYHWVLEIHRSELPLGFYDVLAAAIRESPKTLISRQFDLRQFLTFGPWTATKGELFANECQMHKLYIIR